MAPRAAGWSAGEGACACAHPAASGALGVHELATLIGAGGAASLRDVPPVVLRLPIAVAAGLALADASVVVLALPPILSELDTSVEGVAAVIGAYTLALALALPAGEWLRRRIGAASTGVAGLAVFGAAGAGCGSAETLEALRAVQAVGAALALVAAFELLGAAGSGRRAWIAAPCSVPRSARPSEAR
jgi:hypothetical protein